MIEETLFFAFISLLSLIFFFMFINLFWNHKHLNETVSQNALSNDKIANEQEIKFLNYICDGDEDRILAEKT